MIWKNRVSQLVTSSQRKILAAAIVYAISVIVHFTSPVGDGTRIPKHFSQTTNPVELRNAIYVRHSTGGVNAPVSEKI